MFKKIFLSSLFVFTCVLSCFAYSEDEISLIEQNHYGQVFSDDSLADRLNRLETDFFGMSQTGDINNRLDMLSKMAKNSKGSAIVTPDYDYYSVSKTKKGNAIKNLWDNITEPFADGVITGYTPPIDFSNGHSSYSNSYGNTFGNTFGNSFSNRYGNNFMNFLNNQPQYCPYHNQYHSNYGNGYSNSSFRPNKFFNRRYHNHLSDSNNRYNHRYNNHRFHKHRNYMPSNNSYYPYNPYGARNSMPTNGYTNVSAGSRIHILRD